MGRSHGILLLFVTLLGLISSGAGFRNSVKTSVEEPVACRDGDTKEPGCKSVCRWLNITTSQLNGHCKDWVTKLQGVGKGDDANNSKLGTYKVRRWYTFWRKSSSMEPLIKVLSSNCKEDELDFYAAALYQLIEGVKKDQPVEFKKFDDELAILQEKLSDVVTEKMVKMVSQDDMGGDDDTPLPACPADFGIEAGDFLTFSYGGPNFEEAGGIMKEIAFEDEAMQLRIHYSYGPYFDYSQTFNTTSDVEYKNRTLGSKVGRFFELSWKHTLNAIVRAGKAVGDLTANGGKLLWDMTVNAGKVLGKMAMWTGAGVAKVYSRVRQTTPHTNQTKWTHTEMGIGGGRTISAYGRGVYSNGFPVCKNPGEIVISRFVGDGTVNAAAYRKLAAERALMWEPYLGHYADTVGQWHRAVFGHCMSWLGTPGKSEYFEAVTPERVEEMWNYTPSEQDTERGFFDGMRDNFRTHASTNHSNHTRIKPKAMFCSKLVAAVWSSTIGNPTASPDAQPRSEDLKKMFPFNPGACSPWTLVQWLLSKKGRETWHSCIAEPGRNFHACGWYR